MFILEDPYVSRRLALAAAGSDAPVLDTAPASVMAAMCGVSVTCGWSQYPATPWRQRVSRH
jgi:hypothetical protein